MALFGTDARLTQKLDLLKTNYTNGSAIFFNSTGSIFDEDTTSGGNFFWDKINHRLVLGNNVSNTTTGGTALLEVFASGGNQANLFINQTGTNNANFRLRGQNYAAEFMDVFAGSDGAGKVFGFYGYGTGDMVWATGGTERVRLKGPFFGIGTTNPSVLLHVVSNASSVIFGTGTINNFMQLNIKNTNAGTTASSDLVATADTGTDTTNYVNLGINSSVNSDVTFTIASPLDAYCYSSNSNLWIGTAASKVIGFFIGGTLAANEVARFSSAGNLGLGLGGATPTSRLHIAISSNDTTLFNSIGQEGLRYQNVNNTVNNWQNMIFTNAGGSSSAGIAVQNLSHVSQSGRMYFGTGQSGALLATMVLDETGKVGIGVSGLPTQKLEILGNMTMGRYSGSDYSRVTGIGAGDGSLAAGATYIQFTELSGSGSNGSTKGGNIDFYTHSWGVATAIRARLTAVGNLGIGTTTPAAKLDVVGTIRSTAQANPGTGVGAELCWDGSESIFRSIDRTANLYKPFYVAGSKLYFQPASGGGGTEVYSLFMDTTGYVRIGDTTTPTARLHLKAGTATANTAPLKIDSGTLLTTAEAGAVEFLTDSYYGTVTTGAARRTFAMLESAQTFTANQLFTARMETAVGTTAASANDLTLGGDGNIFNVTGTTNVNGIATANWQSGSVIVLVFQGNFILKNVTAASGGFASCRLAGNADFQPNSNNSSIVLYFDGGLWTEITRTVI